MKDYSCGIINVCYNSIVKIIVKLSKMSDKKPKSKLEKILMWFILWWAVAWAVWAWLKTEKGQQVKEDLAKKLKESSENMKGIINQKEKGETFWHFLNRLFIKKK